VAWCGDVTYIPTDEGWLYLASVIDLASRHLLGYSMGWRGLTMTPKALRLLQHLRRQLLHPPTPRKRSTNLSQPLRIITQEPAPDPFTPLLERHRETYSLPWG
jgi:transposase InsO family protein